MFAHVLAALLPSVGLAPQSHFKMNIAVCPIFTIIKMTVSSSKYIRVHNAAMEIRRALRKRQSGEIALDGCIIRWDTKERRVSIESQLLDEDVMDAVRNIAKSSSYGYSDHSIDNHNNKKS